MGKPREKSAGSGAGRLLTLTQGHLKGITCII